MGTAPKNEAKMAHVNLMTDTIIANLPEEGLRSVLRSMLAADPAITHVFEDRAKSYLQKTLSTIDINDPLFKVENNAPTGAFTKMQQTARAMLGCGMWCESLQFLSKILSSLPILTQTPPSLANARSAIDGDIVQAVTAIQKTLFTSSGSRSLEPSEQAILSAFHSTLTDCRDGHLKQGLRFPFERGLMALQRSTLVPDTAASVISNATFTLRPPSKDIETFRIGDISLPRLFSGLWQLSSPSWGSTSSASINEQFKRYAHSGFTAFDMADHYGDAEIIFGSFRSSLTNPEALFGATKYCIFTPTNVTKDLIRANVSERCQRMSSDHIDLLQFHWQFYDDSQYLRALEYLREDERVHRIGLCNFDTQRMEEVIRAGIRIHTNQVQFSLIDSRPAYQMGDVCLKYDVRLLTYGTLLGGFISDKWLGKPEPELFSHSITPSQRKYYEMILNWGDWKLFQELLHVLRTIATKHNVSISNVATRWVLDFPFVGAVIVGTRWGVSDNAEDNLKTYGFHLDDQDRKAIKAVQTRSKRDRLIDLLGDCGGEYR